MSSSDRYPPYLVPNKEIIRRQHRTSCDKERNELRVFEYKIGEHYIMWDRELGLVYWTGIWQAIGGDKIDLPKGLNTDKELRPEDMLMVRGGKLTIQGTWIPFGNALKLAIRTCFKIRHELIPLFGPQFVQQCLLPDHPDYLIPQSQVTANKRRLNQLNQLNGTVTPPVAKRTPNSRGPGSAPHREKPPLLPSSNGFGPPGYASPYGPTDSAFPNDKIQRPRPGQNPMRSLTPHLSRAGPPMVTTNNNSNSNSSSNNNINNPSSHSNNNGNHNGHHHSGALNPAASRLAGGSVKRVFSLPMAPHKKGPGAGLYPGDNDENHFDNNDPGHPAGKKRRFIDQPGRPHSAFGHSLSPGHPIEGPVGYARGLSDRPTYGAMDTHGHGPSGAYRPPGENAMDAAHVLLAMHNDAWSRPLSAQPTLPRSHSTFSERPDPIMGNHGPRTPAGLLRPHLPTLLPILAAEAADLSRPRPESPGGHRIPGNNNNNTNNNNNINININNNNGSLPLPHLPALTPSRSHQGALPSPLSPAFNLGGVFGSDPVSTKNNPASPTHHHLSLRYSSTLSHHRKGVKSPPPPLQIYPHGLSNSSSLLTLSSSSSNSSSSANNGFPSILLPRIDQVLRTAQPSPSLPPDSAMVVVASLKSPAGLITPSPETTLFNLASPHSVELPPLRIPSSPACPLDATQSHSLLLPPCTPTSAVPPHLGNNTTNNTNNSLAAFSFERSGTVSPGFPPPTSGGGSLALHLVPTSLSHPLPGSSSSSSMVSSTPFPAMMVPPSNGSS